MKFINNDNQKPINIINIYLMLKRHGITTNYPTDGVIPKLFYVPRNG
jgi:hypothetical protein